MSFLESFLKSRPSVIISDHADLCLSDDMIELLKNGRVDNALLCELTVHLDVSWLMTDLEIYANGTAMNENPNPLAMIGRMEWAGALQI